MRYTKKARVLDRTPICAAYFDNPNPNGREPVIGIVLGTRENERPLAFLSLGEAARLADDIFHHVCEVRRKQATSEPHK
jgi:hypothetical protein